MEIIYKLYKAENFFYRIHLTPISIFIRAGMRLVFSCDIPYKTQIGSGTRFPHHALGIVIHPEAKIGKNCRILHGVTIGGKSGHKQLPVIGNNVFIGANSVVMGPIKIGDNAVIGAGSVVLHDVKENTVVSGVPAKEINKKNG